MNLSSADQTLQLIAWFLVLIEFILALYVLLLNAWHIANRHVSVFLLFLATSNFGLSLMLGATDASQAAWPTYLLAATSPAIEPGLLLVAVVLLKPQWLRGRWRRAWWPIYGLVFLPVLLTLLDIGLGTRLWYTGLDADAYVGGFALLSEYAAGSLSLPIKVLSFYLAPLVTIIPLLYIARQDQEATPLTRRLAWLLLVAQVVIAIVQLGLRSLLPGGVPTLVTNAIFVLTYAYAGFQQMISERHLQKGRLQIRLTALVLVITVPVLVATVTLVSLRAGELIEQVVVEQEGTELLSALRQFRRVSWTALVAGTVMMLALAWLTIRQVFQPIGVLIDTATAITAGDLTRVAPVEGEDEIGVLAHAFNNMTGQLHDLVASLGQRVAERTTELEQRAMQLHAAADVARVVTSVLDLDRLMKRVVILIGQRFDLYYVGLFLLDETRRWAELCAGTGEAGRALLEQRHRLEVGGHSVVGWCTAYGQPRIALDADRVAGRFESLLLPDTRSEVGLPLIARGRIIGALDVQSVKENDFSQEDVTVLQTMVDQIAVAIDNARLFAKAEESLAELQAVQRHYLREAWAGFAAGRAATGYRYADGDVEADSDAWLPAMTDAQRQNQAVVAPDGDGATTLSLPITLRGEVIGLLGFKKDGEGEWANDDIALAQAVADQVALSLENVRLFDEVQRRARREALVRELTDKMRRTTDVNAILEMAVQGLGETLGSARAFVRLTGADGNTRE